MEQIQKFIKRTTEILQRDERILGLCLGGSWITGEIDQFSDLDCVIVTQSNLSQSKEDMIALASSLGKLAVAFTGDHIGEKRLLICLYDDPIFHVDLKFLQLHEFASRVENPAIIWERDHQLTTIIESTTAQWPHVDYQWMEDRFWVWVHYGATKLGRGEWYETIDYLNSVRSMVLGPLLHIKYNSLPRGVRKLEFIVLPQERELLVQTIPAYSFESIRSAFYATIHLYQTLRRELFSPDIQWRTDAEHMSIKYLDSIQEKRA